jgi:hypothetical protein
MNEQLRKLVDALDKTHNNYVKTVHKLGREYKDIQREIIVADIQNKKVK